jgi:hypothetical protein
MSHTIRYQRSGGITEMTTDQSHPFAEPQHSQEASELSRLETPAQPQPQYQVQSYAAGASTNGFAVASLVLGIIWVYWLGSILAVIFGHISLKQIARNQQSGRGLAVAGLVLGYVGIGTLVIFLAIFIAAAASSSSAVGY